MACEELLKYAEQVQECVLEKQGEDTKLIQRAINSIAKKGTFYIGFHNTNEWVMYAKRYNRRESVEPDSDDESFMMAHRDSGQDLQTVEGFGQLLANKTGLSVNLKKFAYDDFVYTLTPREGYKYIITLRLTEHMLPTKLLESGVKVVTGLWARIWLLQYLSLPYYADDWEKYYRVAIPIFGSGKVIQLGGGAHEESRSNTEVNIPGTLVTGVDAVKAYAEIAGKKLNTPLRSRSFVAVKDFDKAYKELLRIVDKPTVRGGIENIFQRKAYGRTRDGIVVNLYDCTDHCMNSYPHGASSYTGFFTTLLFLHYELMVAKYYTKNKEVALECFKLISFATETRNEYLDARELVGVEERCGLFRVFDLSCVGRDMEDIIKFKKSKWKNGKLELIRNYNPRS